MRGDLDLDTICAISTPPGKGGISVIRVSGDRAVLVLKKLVPHLKFEPRKATLALLRDAGSEEVIDQTVVTVFTRGHSFTGEESVEISCHGSPIVAERILQSLIVSGCRMAQPGEFTYRAFMNGNIDLVQAEAVLNVIESQTLLESRVAFRQLQGNLSEQFLDMERDLLWLLAHIEAGIDFSTENLDVVPEKEVLSKIENLLLRLEPLLHSFESGRRLKEGLRVVLVGKPNAGKSSLLNAILKKNRAIVTPVAGTTRDVVEEALVLDGFRVSFADTAGLRESEDLVEKIGIERTHDEIQKSDLVLYLCDIATGATDEDINEMKTIERSRLRVIFNKADLVNEVKMHELTKPLISSGVFQKESVHSKVTCMSALDKASGEGVLDLVRDSLDLKGLNENAVLTGLRHFENLSKLKGCLGRARNLVVEKASLEFVAFELKDALMALQETLGKRFDDEILDRIFKEFCLGK